MDAWTNQVERGTAGSYTSDTFIGETEKSQQCHNEGDEAFFKSQGPVPQDDVGPSHDREDISDDEFQDYGSMHIKETVSFSGIEHKQDVTGELMDHNVNDFNTFSSINDAALNLQPELMVDKKSDDLEAVSEDELEPDSVPFDQLKSQTSNNLEDLSSEEGESHQHYGNSNLGIKSHSASEISQNICEIQSAQVPDTLTSLEAEPISDGDISQDEDKCVVENDPNMEAGEVHSPKAPTQPVEELLREAEPISADESSDTDGELEADLEAIDSDEGDIGNDSSIKQEYMNGSGCKQGSGYMENISDEENSCLDNDKKSTEKSTDKKSQLCKFDAEKKQLTSNYSEHQEELDYEENDGDDGEMKPELQRSSGVSKEDGEEGELKEDGDDDKDEGECSDDDCEEGEIKEPGAPKTTFVKTVCRFFQRSHCTWGANCRFLHPGINDKGAYQMIEIPGFTPPVVRPTPEWQQQEELIELPPPPMPDIPHVETAWERGLRIAKEQRKKASERKEKEPDFEEKRLNLKVEEEREVNKENEQRQQPKVVVKDPYYDQQAYDEDEYYSSKQEQWQRTQQYENFEVRYNREKSFSPPFREKPPGPPSRYMPPPPPFNPHIDKYGRQMEDRPKPFRPEPPVQHDYPSPTNKRPDEWNDPWRRSKSPAHQKRKQRSRSRGKRSRRSLSDSSNSSRSSSSSGSSRSSRSGSSSGSSSRTPSPEPAPPGVERHDRYGHSPNRYGEPRSAVSVRGRGGFNNYDDNQGYRGHRGGRGRGRGGYDRDMGGYNHRGGYDNRRGGYNDYRGGYNDFRGGYRGRGRGFYDRNMRDPRFNKGHDRRDMGRRRPSPPDRPLPYVRPRRKSSRSRGSSGSSSSGSRSRSRSRSYSSDSRSRSDSRSSSRSSRSSSSSSSTGSADSDNLYRDLAGGHKSRSAPQHKKKVMGRDMPVLKTSKPSSKSAPLSKRGQQPKSPSSKHSMIPHQDLERIPRPKDQKTSLSSRQESKYASQNAPQVPTKPKDPLKMVGLKSNIKLTLQPKGQQQSSRGIANPLDSPPHGGHQGLKRRITDRDRDDPPGAPPSKRTMLRDTPAHSQAALKAAQERATKLSVRQEIPQSLSQRAKTAVTPQKVPKTRPSEPMVGKPAPKQVAAPSAGGAKVKKSMSSRREELLKQLKAVEDAIQRKKTH